MDVTLDSRARSRLRLLAAFKVSLYSSVIATRHPAHAYILLYCGDAAAAAAAADDDDDDGDDGGDGSETSTFVVGLRFIQQSFYFIQGWTMIRKKQSSTSEDFTSRRM